MGKQLVLVGAGHAHLSTFLNLHHFVRLSHRPLVISPHPHYTYSGMGPGVLSGIYSPEQGRVHIQRLVELRGARLLIGTVEGVDPDKGRLFLTDGTKIDYDVVSFNIGSRVPDDSFRRLEGSWIKAKPIDNFPVARQQLLDLSSSNTSPQLLVIGGGPAGYSSGRGIRHPGGRTAAGCGLHDHRLRGSTLRSVPQLRVSGRSCRRPLGQPIPPVRRPA